MILIYLPISLVLSSHLNQITGRILYAQKKLCAFDISSYLHGNEYSCSPHNGVTYESLEKGKFSDLSSFLKTINLYDKDNNLIDNGKQLDISKAENKYLFTH